MKFQTISKSTKRRYPAEYHYREGKHVKRELGTDLFKEVVEKWPVGRNKKGETIYASKTSHERQ
jgi:hypothetical protein